MPSPEMDLFGRRTLSAGRAQDIGNKWPAPFKGNTIFIDYDTQLPRPFENWWKVNLRLAVLPSGQA